MNERTLGPWQCHCQVVSLLLGTSEMKEEPAIAGPARCDLLACSACLATHCACSAANQAVPTDPACATCAAWRCSICCNGLCLRIDFVFGCAGCGCDGIAL